MAVAAQKNHYAIYLTCAYQDPKQAAWLKEAVSQLIKSTPPEKFIAQYEASRVR